MKKTKYITAKEASKICGVHSRTIVRWIEKSILEGRQLSKYGRWYISYLSIPTFLRKEK